MVSGCWFHYAQALVKRLRKIGLTDSYNNHQETQTTFCALLALPLLPMADIRPAFDDVKSLLMDDSPRKDLLQKLDSLRQTSVDYEIHSRSIAIVRARQPVSY